VISSDGRKVSRRKAFVSDDCTGQKRKTPSIFMRFRAKKPEGLIARCQIGFVANIQELIRVRYVVKHAVAYSIELPATARLDHA